MKKMLVALTLLATTLLTGCSNYDADPDKSTRYSNVSIIESTNGVHTVTDSNGDDVRYKYGGIQISVSAYSSSAEIYTMVVPYGSEAPSNKELAAQKDYGNVKVLFNFQATGFLYQFIDDAEFEQGEKFDCYAVIKNGSNFSSITYKTTVFTYTEDQLEYKGDGSFKDPYEVYTVEDLENVGVVTADRANALTGYYQLMNNIDLSGKYNEDGESWNPIGQVNGKRNKFAGYFDGKGFTINGLYQNTDIEGTGLFSELDVEGWITSVILTNVNINTTTQRTAAVVGYCKGNVYNVAVLGGEINTTANRCGGITGHMYDNGHINATYVDVIINSTSQNAGGIVGQASSVSGSYTFSIKNSQFVGEVNADSGNAGGIVGSCEDTTLENNIVSGATVTASGRAGGIGGSIKSKNQTAKNVSNNIVYDTSVYGKSGSGVLYSDGSSTGAVYSNNQYLDVTTTSGSLGTSQMTSKVLSTLFGTTNLQTELKYSTAMYTFRTNNFPMLNIAYNYENASAEGGE